MLSPLFRRGLLKELQRLHAAEHLKFLGENAALQDAFASGIGLRRCGVAVDRPSQAFSRHSRAGGGRSAADICRASPIDRNWPNCDVCQCPFLSAKVNHEQFAPRAS